MDWTVKFTDLAIVFATFTGPIAAVRIQKFLDRRGEQERSQIEIYRTLMASRANPNSPQYVNVLNSVPLEFRKFRPVMDAWTDLLLHLNSNGDANPEAWGRTRTDRFVTLLKALGTALRYDFRDAELTDHAYFPTWQLNLSNDQEVLRKGLVDLMKGEKSLPMKVTGIAINPEVQQNQFALQGLLIEWLEGKRTPNVSTEPGKAPEAR
jgi:hypothetical protein